MKPHHIPKAMPLVADTLSVEHFILTDHAIERCMERGIGIMEVYSALAEPTGNYADAVKDNRVYVRGDVRVVVDMRKKVVITVADLNEARRTEPRHPINPLIPKKGAVPMPRASTKVSQSLDEAWVLVAHAEPDYRLITVTPELAAKLLELNVHNRPLRNADVQEWMAKIASGEYKPTHQGGAMDSKGNLQDGQHRLTAIANGNIAVQMWFSVGQPPENFDILDTGRNRNYGDVLALSGEADVFALGSTVRLVHLFLGRDYAQWSKGKITNHVVMEEFRKDPDGYRAALAMGRQITAGIPVTRTAAGAAFYVISRVNPKGRVEEFFDGLISGAIGDRRDPRLVLKRNVERAARERERANAALHLALVIKTWNAWVEGEEIRVLSWRRTESMPRVTRTNGKG